MDTICGNSPKFPKQFRAYFRKAGYVCITDKKDTF